MGAAERLRQADRHRPSARRRGYDRDWEQARAAFLQEHPRCAECGQRATEVHHSVPHHGNPALFWDRSRWVPLCHRHHSAETMREISARRRA